MTKVNDKWFRTLVIVLPLLLGAVTGGVLQLPFQPIKIYQFIVSIASTIIICEGVRLIMYKGRQSGLNKTNTIQSELAVIFGGLAFTSLMLAASKVLKGYIGKGQWDMVAEINSSLLVNGKQLSIDLGTYSVTNAIINFFFLYTCYKLLFHYARVKETERMKEVLVKEKLRAELQQLKGIVNPHFLFNNLNSLSSLIVEDPAKAEVFLDELTKVFRYLLRNNNNDLTTLAAELEFIQSYYHLLQIRYGSSIDMRVDVNEAYQQLMLPPLTLQLLLENAVKHNQLQKDNPLQIDLYAAPGKKLVMKNNVIRKSAPVESTGIGLQSINARYRMLDKQGVSTEQTGKEFWVFIPLVD